MYWRTFINTSGCVLKIVTNKNGAKFPRSMATCMVNRMVARGNP